jgi:hypothetical protein
MRDVLHFLNTGELRGVLKGKHVRRGLQAELSGDFELIAQGNKLPAANLNRLDEEAFKVSIRRFRTDPADRMPILHFGFKTVEAIASYQALEIYKARLKPAQFPGDLFRCRACDTFAFSSDVSKPTSNRRTVFCRSECELEDARDTARDRKAASRLGIPVEEWRRRKAAGE